MSQVPMNLPFEQLASYDKPQLLLTQALDNELTVRGALQTLVDTDSLTPNERDLFTTRLKERIGRNPITDSVVDIVTNPFVLLMMVTSPVAGAALSRTGKAIFDVGERYSPFVKEQGGLLAALGLLAPTQLFKGTALTPAVQAFTKGVDQMEKQMLDTVADPLRKVLERHGLQSLNPEKVADAAKKAKALELNQLLWASLEGADQANRVVKYRALEEDGKWVLKKVMDGTTGPLVTADLKAVAEREGMTDVIEAFRKARDDRRMALFGNAAESARQGKFVADEQKLLRSWQGIRMGHSGSGALAGTGADMAATILGPEVTEQILAGTIGRQEILQGLREMIENQPANYMPRNIIDIVGENVPMDRLLEQRRSRALVATGSTLTRMTSAGVYHPEDLRGVFSRFGMTEDGAKLLQDTEKKLKALKDKGDQARVYRINAQESLSRYFRDTGVTHALYVQTVDDLPMLSQRIKDTAGTMKPEKVAQLQQQFGDNPLLDGRQSLAEVFYRQHYALEDRFAKEALEVMLRGAVGSQKVEHVATHMAILQGKRGIRTMLDSGIGKAMKDSGSWGKGLYQKFDEMANAELTFGEAKGMSGQLARYFYVTHLGLNLGSVTMNMMQPLLYASVYGGLGNVMKAYTQAFKEMGSYVKERIGTYGFKALTDEQHRDLIAKHFKYANADGDNLIQIGRDTFSTLDSISYKSQALAGVNRKESYFFDYPMKLFEKAEWMNRNVAAYSVENAYRKAGIDVARGTPGYQRMLSDVGEMVGATQFGGSTLNTPLAFQGVGPFGRLGNNPLFRQFLSFPLRTLTTLAYDSPRFMDRGVFKGIGQDFIRGMGISAVFYEAGKNTFGADLSPGLFGASLTQAVGGDRFFQDGNEYIPIPPVVDIPMNLIRGALDPGQRDLLQNNIPRLIPGGIAASRVMGLLPNLMETPLFGLPGSLQKTYIDPKQRTEDGRIAVFKGDGTLIDYQNPGQIFAKALGVDMGTFGQTADFDGFLLKNREQIVQYRQQAIQALLGNDIPKMQAVRAEFKRRYGMDLTISKDQLDQAIKNRTVSRTERILDRMPPDQRQMFQQMAAGRAAEMGLEPEAITGADTARQRMEARRIEALPTLNPEQQAAFASFQGF